MSFAKQPVLRIGLNLIQRQNFLFYGAGSGHQQVDLMSLMRRHINVKAPMIAEFERKSAPPF